ncbi:hypothetical protein QF046_000267 [Microbacterium sp. W4I4]|uniref:hypothetical protein n=1 Tax=Microbacterium sp. W4I4 TaxID=3042295 RepID=UPI0027852EA4|nr:hypothetical protein [Microbacterium sp. W4I4]MDQ0612626.1 hypothetical protein [Microbacterium sp. W4I4]
MTFATSSLRAVGALSAGLLALGMLAACTPEPEPKPTKTALFASDEEAFAAAEETYRAYTDAVNAVDTADPKSFEPVYQWLTGTALAPEKESLTLYHAENLKKTGVSTFDSFTPVSNSADEIIAQLCLDTGDVDLITPDGESALPANRAARHGRKVLFVPAGTSTGLQIMSSKEPTSEFTC